MKLAEWVGWFTKTNAENTSTVEDDSAMAKKAIASGDPALAAKARAKLEKDLKTQGEDNTGTAHDYLKAFGTTISDQITDPEHHKAKDALSDFGKNVDKNKADDEKSIAAAKEGNDLLKQLIDITKKNGPPAVAPKAAGPSTNQATGQISDE